MIIPNIWKNKHVPNISKRPIRLSLVLIIINSSSPSTHFPRHTSWIHISELPGRLKWAKKQAGQPHKRFSRLAAEKDSGSACNSHDRTECSFLAAVVSSGSSWRSRRSRRSRQARSCASLVDFLSVLSQTSVTWGFLIMIIMDHPSMIPNLIELGHVQWRNQW